MKKLAFAAALLSATALAGAAFAEDAASGWYGSARTGVSIMNDPEFTITDTIASDTLVTELKTKNAWAVAGELGYRWDNFRAGVELSYQRHSVDGINFRSLDGTAITAADVSDAVDFLVNDGVLTPAEAAALSVSGTTVHTSDSFAHLRQVGVMGNVAYDIPTGSMITPYVTGGLGVVNTDAESGGESDSVSRFAWQVGAGAAVEVAPNVKITADYRYRQVSGGDLGDNTSGVNLHLGRTSSHFIGAGLRVSF